MTTPGSDALDALLAKHPRPWEYRHGWIVDASEQAVSKLSMVAIVAAINSCRVEALKETKPLDLTDAEIEVMDALAIAEHRKAERAQQALTQAQPFDGTIHPDGTPDQVTPSDWLKSAQPTAGEDEVERLRKALSILQEYHEVGFVVQTVTDHTKQESEHRCLLCNAEGLSKWPEWKVAITHKPDCFTAILSSGYSRTAGRTVGREEVARCIYDAMATTLKESPAWDEVKVLAKSQTWQAQSLNFIYVTADAILALLSHPTSADAGPTPSELIRDAISGEPIQMTQAEYAALLGSADARGDGG